MTAKKYSIFILFFLVLIAMVLLYQQSISAQGSTFIHVIPVDGGQGSIRFFDTSNGKLYTYDRTLQKVIRIVQLQELGKPATTEFTPDRDGESLYTNPRERR